MHPILRLIEHDGCGAFEHLIGDFHGVPLEPFAHLLADGGLMLVGRLVGSSLSKISPRVQLVVTTVSAGALALLAILLNNPWLLTAVGLFHSIMWGAIFTLSVAHLGKYTSVASGVFMIGVVGGAILPLLQGILADVLGSWRWSWFIVLLGEIFMLYYALIGSRIRQTAD